MLPEWEWHTVFPGNIKSPERRRGALLFRGCCAYRVRYGIRRRMTISQSASFMIFGTG